MSTLNIRGAFVFAVVFLLFAQLSAVVLPEDTDVHFSLESGFYDEPVTLAMRCDVLGADIYYTTDGSIPTPDNFRYTGPITIESRVGEPNVLSAYADASADGYAPEESMVKGSVIRARAFWGDGKCSAVESASYFVGVDRQAEYGDVAVISLIMEENDLFGYEDGIYVMGEDYDEWYSNWDGESDVRWEDVDANFLNRGQRWERPAHVEFLSPDGSVGFSQVMGVRIKGGLSRFNGHKSLRLTARSEYGHSRIEADPYGTQEKPHNSFTLRSGGNDCNLAKIREPLIHNLARNMRFDTQRSQPCVAFINGEYWGLYTLNEEYSAHFIEHRHEIDSQNAVIVKKFALEDGQPEDYDLFKDMMRFLERNDLSTEENHQQAASLIDLGSLADYFALQFYVDNIDGLIIRDNNWQMWRARTMDSSKPTGDGCWRMMLFDVDQGARREAALDNLTPALSGETEGRFLSVLRSLCGHEDFRRELVNALCDVRSIHFAPERFAREMNALRTAYEPLMPDSIVRFGPQEMVEQDVAAYCAGELNAVESYFTERWETFPQIVQQALDLSEPAEATIRTLGSGSVTVNHSEPDMTDGYTGLYFPEYPITLTAEGRFVRWEYEGCTLSDPASPVTEVSFDGDFSVTAIFE